MRITETKFVVLQFLNLTDALTLQEHRCTRTFIRNHNLKLCTRTCKQGSKDARNSINVDRCSFISFTSRRESDIGDNTSEISIILNCNVTTCTFTITSNRYVVVNTVHILSTTVENTNFFDLSVRCDVCNDGKFLVETTWVDKLDACNRSNRFWRGCRVEGTWVSKLIITNGSDSLLRFNEKWEIEGSSLSSSCRNSKSTRIRTLDNVNKGSFTNRRVCSSSRWIKIV